MQSITTDTTKFEEAPEKTQKTSNRYQAIGTIEGVLEINDLNYTLKVGEYSYPVRVRKKAFEKYQVGQSQHFRVYPYFKEGRLFFVVKGIVEQPPSMSFILRGNWEIYDEEPRLIIYRNQRFQKIGQEIPILPLSWPDAPPADGRFWAVEAQLQEDKLVVIKAEGSLKAPPYSSRHQQRKTREKIQVTQSPEAIAQLKATFLTTERIQKMAVLVEAQITCKVHNLPEYQELPDKQIKFFLTSGNGCIFSVMMKPQMFQKLAEYNFGREPALVSGILGAATATGFKLIHPSIEVSEDQIPAAKITPIVLKAQKPEAIKIESVVPQKQSKFTKQQSTQEPLTAQKILAVVAKADSPQDSKTKGTKSKKEASKAKK